MDTHAAAAALRALADALERPSPTPQNVERDDDHLTVAGWLTITQTAKRFRIGRSTVDRLIKSGEWPTPVRLPGMRNGRFSPEQLAQIERGTPAP